jgi:hypothetical protein
MISGLERMYHWYLDLPDPKDPKNPKSLTLEHLSISMML